MGSHATASSGIASVRLRLAAVNGRGAAFAASLLIATAVYLASQPLDPGARTTLAIVVGAALLWITEALPLYVTGMAALAAEIVLLALPGRPLAAVGPKAFVASFFDPVLLLFLGGFAMGEAISSSGLDRHLVQGMLRRVPATAPWVLGGTLAITGFMSMWMSNTATAALMMAVMLPLVRRLAPGDPFRRALLLAVPFAANIGGIGTPVGTPPNVIALGALQRMGITISFLQWMAMAVPLVAVLLAIVGWVLLRRFPAGNSSLAALRDGDAGPSRLTGQQRFAAAVAVVTALGWLTSIWHGIPEYVVAMVPILAIFGARMLRAEDFRRLEWDILVLMGGGLSLGFALQESGLAGWAIDQMHLGRMGAWASVAAAAGAAVVLATFISHTAAAALLVPVVAGVGGPHAAALAVAAAIGVSGAMALPVSTPPNAIAFSSGELRVADMARAGSLVGLLTVILTTVAVCLFLGD